MFPVEVCEFLEKNWIVYYISQEDQLPRVLSATTDDPVREKCHTCQVFHINRLDVYNVEALITDFQVPQIYPQIIG
jgi:hypothetical protein